MAETVTKGLQGTIKTVRPMMENGVHDTWSKDGAVFYKFWYVITVDGKDISSNVLHKTTTSKVKEGDKVIFDKTDKDGKIKFSNIKKDDGNSNSGNVGFVPYKDKYNDPMSIAGASFTGALDLVSEYFTLTHQVCPSANVLEKVAFKIHTWFMKGQEVPSKDLIYQRKTILYACIKRAEDWKEGDKVNLETVLKNADELWRTTENVKSEYNVPAE